MINKMISIKRRHYIFSDHNLKFIIIFALKAEEGVNWSISSRFCVSGENHCSRLNQNNSEPKLLKRTRQCKVVVNCTILPLTYSQLDSYCDLCSTSRLFKVQIFSYNETVRCCWLVCLRRERETLFFSNSPGKGRVRPKIDPVSTFSCHMLVPQWIKGYIKIQGCPLTPVPQKHIFQGQQQSH